jgi:hypothetical protein
MIVTTISEGLILTSRRSTRAASFGRKVDFPSGKYWPFLTAQAGEGVKNYARDYDLVS